MAEPEGSDRRRMARRHLYGLAKEAERVDTAAEWVESVLDGSYGRYARELAIDAGIDDLKNIARMVWGAS